MNKMHFSCLNRAMTLAEWKIPLDRRRPGRKAVRIGVYRPIKKRTGCPSQSCACRFHGRATSNMPAKSGSTAGSRQPQCNYTLHMILQHETAGPRKMLQTSSRTTYIEDKRITNKHQNRYRNITSSGRTTPSAKMLSTVQSLHLPAAPLGA